MCEGFYPIHRLEQQNLKVTFEKEVLKRAEKLQKMLIEKNISTSIIETRAKIGGGSMPEETVPSYALVFTGDAVKLEKYFRTGDINIIGRVADDSFILDIKTIRDEDMEIIVEKAINM